MISGESAGGIEQRSLIDTSAAYADACPPRSANLFRRLYTGRGVYVDKPHGPRRAAPAGRQSHAPAAPGPRDQNSLLGKLSDR